MPEIEKKLLELVGPVLESLPDEQQPVAVALAERIAAERYRSWAGSVADPEARSALLACAEREEEIARRVEAIVPDAASIQSKVRAAHPDLPDQYAALFSGVPLREQFAMQAKAERVGALTWRSFAKAARPEARDVFLECAQLEERSAETLESLCKAS